MPTITDQRAGPKRKEGIQWTDIAILLVFGIRVVMISGLDRRCYADPALNTRTCKEVRMSDSTLFDNPPTVNRRIRKGPENNFWKGGRSVASNGYVLIRVGTDHHLADVRGYAYEHRIVAEQKIGRRLRSGEQVHHVNGNKQDNRPENLQVMASCAHHRVEHRRVCFSNRMPDEPNPITICACGCGEQFSKYDELGRPRTYVSGHNPPKAPLLAAIIDAISTEPKRAAELAMLCGTTIGSIKCALTRLRKSGRAEPIAIGLWGICHDK